MMNSKKLNEYDYFSCSVGCVGDLDPSNEYNFKFILCS